MSEMMKVEYKSFYSLFLVRFAYFCSIFIWWAFLLSFCAYGKYKKRIGNKEELEKANECDENFGAVSGCILDFIFMFLFCRYYLLFILIIEFFIFRFEGKTSSFLERLEVEDKTRILYFWFDLFFFSSIYIWWTFLLSFITDEKYKEEE